MQTSNAQDYPGRGRIISGIVCIGLGILSAIIGMAAIGVAGGGAAILLIIGIALIVSGRKRRRAWLNMQEYIQEIRRERNS